MRTTVTVHHLEMLEPGALRPAAVSGGEPLCIVQARIVSPELNRYLYTAVGGDWYWIDRLGWSRDQWLQWLDRPEVETWVVYAEGTPAGYFELEAQAQGSVEIAYIGLLPQFVGHGFGGELLTAATRRAWERPARRVWLHTCSLDHPRALANYVARGFRKFREETLALEVPERPPGPWPGATP